MKKKSFFAFLILIFPLFIQAGAIIKFKEKAVSFGKIEWGKIASIEFGFENVGDSILIIKKISSSCGCVIADLPKREFNPGERGAINIWFKSRGYYGEVTKTLTVKTNDLHNPKIRLQFFGKVISRRSSRIK